ncbi:MAG: site-specific integrase [Planctomycetes bacterium]|nr:site-specific integrase [Planctomycetota bacterium]
MVRYGTIRRLTPRGKPTSTYFVRVYRGGGKDTWLSTGCKTRQAALAWVQDQQLERAQERSRPSRLPIETKHFSEVFALWLESKQGMVSQKHFGDLRHRESFWLPYFGNRVIANITASDVRRYLQLRKVGAVPGALTGKPIAVYTLNNDLTWLKALFSFAIDEGWIERSPARAIKPMPGAMKRRIRTLALEEETRLLNACRESPSTIVEAKRNIGGRRGGASTDEKRKFAQKARVQPYLYYLVLTALYCGFRRRTLLSLRWRDIDFAAKRWRVPGEFVKTATDYEAPIPARVLKELAEYRETLRQGEDAVARCRPDASIFGLRATSSIRKSFQSAVRRAGLRGFTFHDCRRVYLNRLRDNGVSMETAMALTGHRSIQTVLEHYRQVPEADLLEAVKRIDGGGQKYRE